MNKFLAFIFMTTIFCIGLVIPQADSAVLLYDNGPSTHDGGSAIGHLISADDFMLSADSIIAGASVDVSDGSFDGNRLWDETVEWWILDNNGGAPGNVIASGVGFNATQSNLVTSASGYRDFTVDFDFGQSILITAGQVYWLALHFQQDYSRLSVFWDFNDSIHNSVSYSGGELVGDAPDFTGTYGGQSTRDKAFRLKRYDTATCVNGDTTDTDEDGLFDCWETNGIDSNGDGTVDLQLYDVDGDGVIEDDPNGDGDTEDTERADPQHRDVYLEIDWMAQHQPQAAAVNQVIDSFADATVDNPDTTQGIRLHIQVDEEAVAHNADLAIEPNTGPAGAGVPDFDNVKSTRFGTADERANPNSVNILNAKRLVFHYTLFAHNLQGKGSTSGTSELPGNDFVVSLGSWDVVGGHGIGSVDQQAGTLMHELGHNLSLLHGGGDYVNCKPNYLSIMSYSRQFDNNPIIGRPLDYSEQVLDKLDETDLSEPAGIGGPIGEQTVFGPPLPIVVSADLAINWNRDPDSTDTGVSADINNMGFNGCRGFGTILTGHNDWTNLLYNLRESSDFADGVRLTGLQIEEITFEEALSISPDSDDDGIVNLMDNCPFVSNPDQADSNENGFGDACAPVADAGLDQTVECTSPVATSLQLDGTGSSDPTPNDTLTYSWTTDCPGGSFDDSNIPTPVLTVDTSVACDISCNAILTVADENGETDVDSMTVDIRDTVSPQTTCPADMTIECTVSPDPGITGILTATDVCDPTLSKTFSDTVTPGACPEESSIARTWTATDDCGNSSSCVQTIDVVDTAAPFITCPSDTTIECDQSPDPAITGAASATDECDPSTTITFSDTVAPGTCSEESTITRNWTATDNCGNSSSCVQTIEVVDTNPPVITCNAPATITPLDAPSSFTSTATDNCAGDPSVEIIAYDCFFFTKKGKRIDKTESCIVEVNGDTINIVDSGGVDDNITWTVRANDNCGNVTESTCSVVVVKPEQP